MTLLIESRIINVRLAARAYIRTFRSFRFLVCGSQGIVEIETKEAGILADYGCRHDVEYIVVGLLRNLVPIAREQPPKVSVLGIRRHGAKKSHNLFFSPIV
jgi:hypothetical protein